MESAAAKISPMSDEEIAEMVNKYGSKSSTSASLETLLKTGRGELLSMKSTVREAGVPELDVEKLVLIQIANFLRREIPVRLAHRIQDLSSIPLLRDMESTKAVKQIYVDSLLRLSLVPPITTPEQEEEYAAELDKLYEKHSSVLIQMAKGAYELRKKTREEGKEVLNGKQQQTNRQSSSAAGGSNEFEQMQQYHSFLDTFYMSRIGIRVLAGQYLALRQQQLHSDPADDNNEYINIICKSTSPHQIVLQAAEDATWMCQRRFGDAPDVIVNGNLDLHFPYVPTHLHYILLELIKNAMRATMEKHCGNDDGDEVYHVDADVDVPPVHVVIADSLENEDVAIKISDEGGGIPRSNMKHIWSYLFTTASPSIQEKLVAFGDDGGASQDHSIQSPLAGLGYGLPISRSYARYFGGDLSIMSMEGYGTDCFLHLRRLGNSKEPLTV